MTYRRSPALQDWFGHRREDLRAIEDAHRQVAQASHGAGRPFQRGGDQIAQAFIIRMYAEFQGFVRELHDIAILAFVRGSRVPAEHRPPVITAASDGRRLDQGNAGLDAIKRDFRRVGLADVGGQLATLNPHYVDDRSRHVKLTDLRNALAHANSEQLRTLRSAGIRPTLTWGRRTLPALNRIARALDRAVWNHVRTDYPAIDPWGTT